jgi:hypothetical protein
MREGPLGGSALRVFHRTTHVAFVRIRTSYNSFVHMQSPRPLGGSDLARKGHSTLPWRPALAATNAAAGSRFCPGPG